MGLVEQQAHAEIDPRPDKEEEDDDGLLRDPSFIGSAVQGGAPPRSDASSPKLGTPIGPQPPHGLAAMAGSGLIGASGEILTSCGIVSLRTPWYALL